jgi:hypothetical protein
MCELEPRSESLTSSLLEGVREKGSKGTGGGKLNCLISLPSFIAKSACWTLPPRSAAKNYGGCYTLEAGFSTDVASSSPTSRPQERDNFIFSLPNTDFKVIINVTCYLRGCFVQSIPCTAIIFSCVLYVLSTEIFLI